MKYTYRNILGGAALLLGLASCQKYDIDPIYHDSAILKFKRNSISVLNNSLNAELDFVSKSKKVTDVKVLFNDKVLWSGLAEGNKVSFVLNRADIDLDVHEINTTSQRIFVDAVVDGRTKSMYSDFTVANAVGFKGFPKVYVEEDGEEVLKDDHLYYGADTVKSLVYEIDPDVTLDISYKTQQKIGAKGEYKLIEEGIFTPKDTIFALNAVNYDRNDTIFYRVLTSTTAGKDTANFKLTLVDRFVKLENEVSLRASDLQKGLALNLNSDKLETYSETGVFIQLVNGDNSKGLKATGLKFYMPKTSAERKTLSSEYSMVQINKIMSENDVVETVENLKTDDFVFFSYENENKKTKKTDTYVGRLNISSVNLSNTPKTDFMSFKYGVYKVDLVK